MSLGLFRLASGRESEMARGDERRPAPDPAPSTILLKRTYLETSGLAPNRPEPVTWLPHLPTKITT